MALVVLAELYLAGDHLSGMAYAAILAPCVVAVAFRWLVPEEGFPVTYRKRGSAAHLDLGGERGAAIVRAMADQLGLAVTEVKEFGLEGSGGSSPLRMTLQDGSRVFGKIYSTSHERADRWYRFGRTILYGQLEDARNLGDSQIDDVVIDEGLAMVRTFWDIGVAHRDIKPANLLVREGHLQLVDVSGLEVRPSPWRQAVDLSTCCSSWRSGPIRSGSTRAPPRCSRGEIAEACASAVGLTIPTELQAKLKADGRPLLDRFRQLAPPRDRISIQRWSAQRLVLTAAAVLGTLILVGLFVDSLRAGLA